MKKNLLTLMGLEINPCQSVYFAKMPLLNIDQSKVTLFYLPNRSSNRF